MGILKKIKQFMNTIKINSQTYSNSNSIVIVNDKVYIDGVDVTPNTKNITIEVTGNLEKLNVGACKSIIVHGDVTDLDTTSGDVNCGNVKGNINSTSGDVCADAVHGNVETVSGDVDANTITGNVETLSGNIKYKRI